MRFKLHKNFIVASTLGHSIEFKKNELVHVPKEMWPAVTAIGAVPENELPEDEVAKAEEVVDPAERQAAIFTAFTLLVEKGDRDAFTGNGSPHAKAVSEITGFAIDAKERDRMWADFRQQNAGE